MKKTIIVLGLLFVALGAFAEFKWKVLHTDYDGYAA
jgi:hypothetical protein